MEYRRIALVKHSSCCGRLNEIPVHILCRWVNAPSAKGMDEMATLVEKLANVLETDIWGSAVNMFPVVHYQG